jgi:hypothetical protein
MNVLADIEKMLTELEEDVPSFGVIYRDTMNREQTEYVLDRDIRAMLDELVNDGSDLSHPQEDKDARGYTTCFYLNRELTDTLLTGYSAVARRKVIQRWRWHLVAP